MQAVSKLTNQWIELFRAGNHGAKGDFTQADLDQIVANYQPTSGHEAPATIGHPTGAAPAWGWFDGLKREGSLLLGKMREVQPEFEEMVGKKLFKKRSVGLVKGENGYSLHHVAFLGAQAPEIKGLADCKFEKSGTGVVEITFEEESMADETTLMERFDAWFNKRFPSLTPAAAAATTFSEADVKRIAAEAATAAVAPVQAALDASKLEFAEHGKKFVTTETAARAEAAIAKVKAGGRWVPAFDKMGLPLVFAALATSVETVEFGEGDAKKKVTPLEAFTNFMESLGKIVPVGETYTGQQSAGGKVEKFSEGKHVADPNSVKLTTLAKERAAKDKITFAEAAQLILAEQPELAIPGGASAGQV